MGQDFLATDSSWLQKETSLLNTLWDINEPTHYLKRVGREVPGVVFVSG